MIFMIEMILLDRDYGDFEYMKFARKLAQLHSVSLNYYLSIALLLFKSLLHSYVLTLLFASRQIYRFWIVSISLPHCHPHACIREN